MRFARRGAPRATDGSTGWRVWDYPVDLEPPFIPFHFHPVAGRRESVDDGRKPTFLSSLVDSFRGRSVDPAESNASDLLDYVADLPAEPQAQSPGIRELAISFPADGRLTTEQVDQFLLALSLCHNPVSFEIIGTADRITVQFVCGEMDIMHVEAALRAYFPGVVLERVEQTLDHLTPRNAVVVDFGLSEEFMRPLRVFQSFEPDPLTGVVAALESIGKGETGILQVMFQATRQPWTESVLRSVSDGSGGSFFADAPDMVQLAREKTSRPLYASSVRVAGVSSSEERAWNVVRRLASGLLPVTSYPSSNELIPLTNDDYDETEHIDDVLKRRSRRSGMILNSRELASLVHPPSGSIVSSRLQRFIKKTRPAPSTANGSYVFGENVHQGSKIAVGLSTRQRLNHIHIIGATGTGKSTLLLNLIAQDIERGVGCAIIDPHGDLIDKVMAHVSSERSDDVFLFDPSDTKNPYGVNILAAKSEAAKTVTISDFVSSIRRASSSWGDQMTAVLSNAVQAFLESSRGGTLLELRKFLLEEEFRRSFLKTVEDQEVVYFWEKQYSSLRGGTVSSILTRLDTFLRPKLIRRVIAPQVELDFDDIVNRRKVLLVKLTQGLIGEENSTLLGNLVVSKLHQAAMARQAVRLEEREPFFLYIDEFHNFITPSLAGVLSGARKYGLGLILAHQDLRQLWNQDTAVANSVISNPGTRICFRLGDFDAQKLQDGFSHFTAHDLQSLGVGEAVVRFESATDDFNLTISPPRPVAPEVAKAHKERILELTHKLGLTGPAHEQVQVQPPRAVVPPVETSFIALPPKPAETRDREQKLKFTQEQKPVPVAAIPTASKEEGSLSQHRYLQTLIKRMAEERGYRAVIEEPTPDGLGRVDVGLRRDGEKIACEIAMTTTDEHEIQNIEKCLTAGYNKVVVCSTERKRLEKIRTLALQKLSDADQVKVLFLEPQELFILLEEQGAVPSTKEELVKGYRVKVEYQEVGTAERQNKRDAVAQVILQSIRRLREK